MKQLLLISVLFAAACGGKSSGDTMDPCKDPKLAAMTCDGMADNVAKEMTAAGEMPADAIGPMRDVFAEQCTSQAWSQESIDCMAAVTAAAQGEACERGLTEEQRAAFRAATGRDESETEREPMSSDDPMDDWEGDGGADDGGE